MYLILINSLPNASDPNKRAILLRSSSAFEAEYLYADREKKKSISIVAGSASPII